MYSKKIKSLLEELFTCPICLDILKDPATTKCGHSFCIQCVKKNKFECAVCRSKIEANFTTNYVVKKAIDSLQNMSEEKFENKYSGKGKNAGEYSVLKVKRNEEKLLQTEVKQKRINFSRENNLAKSENVNKYRIKRLRSQIDCFNELDLNYINNISQNGNYIANNSQNLNSVNNQSQNLECNRNLFNNINYENNEYNLKFLYPDNQNNNLNKLTSRVIDNFLDDVLVDFQNGNMRNSFNSSREYTMNFFNNQNIQTPVHNHINNVNINIYNVQANSNQINNMTIQNSGEINVHKHINFNYYDVPGKRFKYN